MSSIEFEADVFTLRGRSIVRLPEEASKGLPSRGQVAVTGTVGGHPFETVIEPDGELGHWMNVGEELQRVAGISAGDRPVFTVAISPAWPEPVVPDDLASALAAASAKVREKWADITPMARWEWVRWVDETRNPATRVVRIEKTVSKLDGKHRRPCCFNLSACTDSELSRSGRLAVSDADSKG